MEQRIVDFFNGSIEATMNAGEALMAPIAESASLICEALLQGVRIFTCGNGISAAQAATLSFVLMNQYRIERPGFAAFCLSADSVTNTGLTQQTNFAELYRRQLRTLGQTGDILVLFSANTNAGNLVQAIQTAHEKDMIVIAFTGSGDGNLSALLTGADVEIRVDHPDPFRIHNIHMLSQFCICELIESQLFGG
ncbi:MAG: SIS domain-containing protein [Porticoccaceae bacterium]|jgi:D-sedoheptulose 7-phosphate isomerase